MIHTLYYSFKISPNVAVILTMKASLHFGILEKRWILKTDYNSKVCPFSAFRKNNLCKDSSLPWDCNFTNTFQSGHIATLKITNTVALSQRGAPHFLSCKITANKHITKRLRLVYSLKKTIGSPEANINHSALREPEQLIVIQPPKTTLHGCKIFLFPLLLSAWCCLLH